MEEKIQWYQEVLQLEPNSKLFFPLALLLSQSKRIPEALEVLRNGLARHDEYLEARLFYIELLYKSGQSAAIAPELQKLQDLFSHYTGFWQAWAAFIASNGNSMDTSALMRFLSLYFTHKDLSLHTVINKGLQALMQEEGAQPLAEKDADIPSAPQEEVQAFVADEPSAQAEGQETPREEELCVPDQAVQSVDDQARGSDTLVAQDIAAPDLATEVEPGVEPGEVLAEPSQGAEASPADALQTGGDIASETLSSETPEEEERVYADAELGEAGLVERSASKAEPSADQPDDDALPEEPISLRTRSMAEVLAEQGDIKGALDIYYELEGSASSVEESADLRQRIATLRGMLTPPKETVQAEKPAKPDKSRVINLIEALSERLEARAQQ